MIIELKDLASQFDEALAKATAGAEIIITRGKVPVARLLPTGQTRVAGLHAGAITITPDFDAPLSDEFWTGAP